MPSEAVAHRQSGILATDPLIEEARLLFPTFFKHGKILPDKELARLQSYNRFLRLGILLWQSHGPDNFREIMRHGFAFTECVPDDARSHLGHLWHGVEDGCVRPTVTQVP